MAVAECVLEVGVALGAGGVSKVVLGWLEEVRVGTVAGVELSRL